MSNTECTGPGGPTVVRRMPDDIRDKCFRIRCQSKEGRGLADEDQRSLMKWRKAYPDDYAAMEHEVFEATRPFGSKGLW